MNIDAVFIKMCRYVDFEEVHTLTPIQVVQSLQGFRYNALHELFNKGADHTNFKIDINPASSDDKQDTTGMPFTPVLGRPPINPDSDLKSPVRAVASKKPSMQEVGAKSREFSFGEFEFRDKLHFKGKNLQILNH